MLIYLSLLDSEEEISKFELIYSTYKKQMYYTANNILKDSHLAEDAVHNAFLNVMDESRYKPYPKELHFVDTSARKYIIERFDNPETEVYVADHEFPDADVTSYIKLIKQSGIVLCGKAIQEVFADVTDEDFFAAISADIDDYDFHDYAPRYFASNVLILGRILSFKRTKKILSKYDGGLWMIENVPADLKYLPQRAMKIWFENEECLLPEEDLERLRDYLVGEIKK